MIGGKVLWKHINDGTWNIAHLKICGLVLPITSLVLVIFLINLVHLEGIDLHVHGKKNSELLYFWVNDAFSSGRRFPEYAFRHSLEYNAWSQNSVEYWIFFIVERLSQNNLSSEPNFKLIYYDTWNYLTEKEC